MPDQPVDYDSIARTYDRRFERGKPDATLEILLALQQNSGARRVLEVGCGTGHWLAGLYEQAKFPGSRLKLHGLDLSRGMLAQAHEKCGQLHLVHGQAERLPYRSQAFDLVYCVNAIHHFADPSAFIKQAGRMLRPGGVLAVIGMDPRGHYDDWYIYRYFPGTYERDLERFPSWGMILDWMLAAGFIDASLLLARHIHDPKTGPAVLEDPYLEKNAASQLALLSEEAYQAGLMRIRQALAKEGGDKLVFATDIYLHVLAAQLPRDRME